MSRKTRQKNQPSLNMSDYCVVYVTTPNEGVAKKIAHGLVKRRLAVGTNIMPKITSIHRVKVKWEDTIIEDSEVLMMIKTKTYKMDQLTAFVKANNPYLVSEVLAVPIINGNSPYLKWIDETVY